MEVDPAACKSVDIRVEGWGEDWVTDESDVDLTALKTAEEMEKQFGISKHDIQNWCRRHPDKVPVRGKRGNRNLYLVRDVLRYWAAKR